MGFKINYGSPDLFGIIIILLLVAAGTVVIIFFLGASKEAHDEIVEEIEDEGGDLKG